MNYAEFMKRRGIPYPSPLGGDAPVGVGTVGANETTPESGGAETSETADGTFTGMETDTPDEEPLADTDTTADAEPTGNRNRRRSAG